MSTILSLAESGREYAALSALGPLRGFFDDAQITEIAINQPGECWTHNGAWLRHEMPTLTVQYLNHMRSSLAHLNPGSSEEASVSVRLPGGARAQINVPEACPGGKWQMCIRKHALRVMTLDELEALGVFDGCADVSFNQPDEARIEATTEVVGPTRIGADEAHLLRLKRDRKWKAFLIAAMHAKRNIVFAGATGSGKTTFMRSLIDGAVPLTDRIITVEDVLELVLPRHPNHAQLLYGTRPGLLSVHQCIQAMLRMRPDRVFLSELRGPEAWSYVRLIRTGHPGSVTSVHANDAIDTHSVVAMLAAEHDSGRTWGREAMMQLLYTTLHIVVYMRDRNVVEVFYDPIFARCAP